MKDNPPRKTALVCSVITIVSIVAIFIPGLLGLEGFEGGYAISFLSLFVSIAGAVFVIVYALQARVLDGVLRGEGLLAHWVYPPQKWIEYSRKEYTEEKIEKKGLFIVISTFALFFGVLFWVIDAEAGFYVFLAMLSLIGIIALAWQVSAWYYYRQNISGVAEAYISRNALYMNHKFYPLHFIGTHFDSVRLENTHNIPWLVFRITTFALPATQTYKIRVPIPDGQEETAKMIIQQLNS